MSLNDRLISAESIDWWHQEIKIQLNKKHVKLKKVSYNLKTIKK